MHPLVCASSPAWWDHLQSWCCPPTHTGSPFCLGVISKCPEHTLYTTCQVTAMWHWAELAQDKSPGNTFVSASFILNSKQSITPPQLESPCLSCILLQKFNLHCISIAYIKIWETLSETLWVKYDVHPSPFTTRSAALSQNEIILFWHSCYMTDSCTGLFISFMSSLALQITCLFVSAFSAALSFLTLPSYPVFSMGTVTSQLVCASPWLLQDEFPAMPLASSV